MLPEIIRPLARKAIGIPGRIVPYTAQRPALSMALNRAFREPLRHGELAFLRGSKIRILVTDLCLDWLIRVEAGRFSAIDRKQREDVTIRGNLFDFVLLASRRADPDSLFFQRRIRVEGDTELGLGIKNTMDSMDWDDLPAPLRHLLMAVGRIVEPLQFLQERRKK